MAIAGTYLVEVDLSRRLTSEVMVQAFDDDEDGDADEDIVNDFIADAEDEVETRIAKVYGEAGLTTLRAQGVSCPRTVKRLALNIFEVLMGHRHPEYIRGKWEARRERCDKDLDDLAARVTELADVTGTIEPAVQEGGYVRSGDPDDTDLNEKLFVDHNSFGIFR